MRKTLSLFAATLLAAAALDPAWGQARGFAGTWVLDAAKSDSLPQGKGQGRGQGKGRRNQANAQGAQAGLTLVVDQTDTELNVARKMGGRGRTREQKYKLDGSETSVATSNGRGEIKAKAHLQGEALVIEGTQKVTNKRGEMDVKLREEWSLSDDGKTLTIKNTRTGRRRDQTTKQVFTKG
jgi:hypothetical protein